MNTPVLDHGFVTLRNMAGPTRRPDALFDADDVDPANSARMSFGKTDGGRSREDDLKLSRYLMKNWHTTPFEMVEIWLEMKMPIFVARQFVRHRTVSINEISGRYVQLPAEWYLPELFHVGVKPENIKQGRDLFGDPNSHAKWFIGALSSACARDYATYKMAIERGIPHELARCFLHLNHYTHWLWKQDLHNMMNFLRLRDHSHAQFESQEFARAVDGHLRANLPHSMALYDEYRKVKNG